MTETLHRNNIEKLVGEFSHLESRVYILSQYTSSLGELRKDEEVNSNTLPNMAYTKARETLMALNYR